MKDYKKPEVEVVTFTTEAIAATDDRSAHGTEDI